MYHEAESLAGVPLVPPPGGHLPVPWTPTCPLDSPSNPSLTANIRWPSAIPTLTAERTAAFMPAAGAPTFNTATLKELCGGGGGSKVRRQTGVKQTVKGSAAGLVSNELIQTNTR